jgi:hypothetical protein
VTTKRQDAAVVAVIGHLERRLRSRANLLDEALVRREPKQSRGERRGLAPI